MLKIIHITTWKGQTIFLYLPVTHTHTHTHTHTSCTNYYGLEKTRSVKFTFAAKNIAGPVGWGCRIHQLHLCRGIRPSLNDIKQSDGEAAVNMELWVMRSTPLLPLLPGPLGPGLVAPDRALSMAQIELNSVFILFTNPSARAGYDTRSIFKRSLTGLNSEFSFS